jgi:hypothetical protein
VSVNAARTFCREQKPGTRVHQVSRSVRNVRIKFGEPALSARQALLSSCQQPFDRLRSVAFDGIPVVVLTAVKEDAEIELRGGVTAFGSKPEVPHSAGFHLGLLRNRRAGNRRRCCIFRAKAMFTREPYQQIFLMCLFQTNHSITPLSIWDEFIRIQWYFIL